MTRRHFGGNARGSYTGKSSNQLGLFASEPQPPLLPVKPKPKIWKVCFDCGHGFKIAEGAKRDLCEPCMIARWKKWVDYLTEQREKVERKFGKL